MDLILDTHAFIWFINGDKLLPETVRNQISATSNKCYISIVSLWEIAIKTSLNKLSLDAGFDRIADFLFENDIQILTITFEHLQQLMKLELHHRDPFDRIIIAQGLSEKLTIATKDDAFKEYDVAIICN